MFIEHTLLQALGMQGGSENTHRADSRGAYILVEEGATHECKRTIVTNATKRVTWCLPDVGEFDLIREVRKST